MSLDFWSCSMKIQESIKTPINALPSSLVDSNVSLKWKQWKNKELETRSLARNTLVG
jgi:hypothetical protein